MEFQGNLKIKNVTLQTLRRDLENLKVSDDESIQNYYTKVTTIVNEMKAFGEEISEAELLKRFLLVCHQNLIQWCP